MFWSCKFGERARWDVWCHFLDWPTSGCLHPRVRSEKIRETEDELIKERDCVGHLVPNSKAAVCLISEE